MPRKKCECGKEESKVSERDEVDAVEDKDGGEINHRERRCGSRKHATEKRGAEEHLENAVRFGEHTCGHERLYPSRHIPEPRRRVRKGSDAGIKKGGAESKT